MWGGRPRNRYSISSRAEYLSFLQNVGPTLGYIQLLIYSVRRKYPPGLSVARSPPPSRVEPKKDGAINLLRHIPSWHAQAQFHFFFVIIPKFFVFFSQQNSAVLFLSHWYSVKSSTPHYCTVHFNIVVTYTLRSSSGFFLRSFSKNMMYLISHSFRCASSSVHLIILRVIYSKIW